MMFPETLAVLLCGRENRLILYDIQAIEQELIDTKTQSFK